jgi:thioredoxin 1
MILFKGGQPAATKVGAAPKSALQSWLTAQLDADSAAAPAAQI